MRERALLLIGVLLPLAFCCGCLRTGFGEPELGETWSTVVAGTFMIGAPASAPCRSDNQDLHQVTLTRAFEIQTTEVTQAQYEAVMGERPSYFSACGDDCPVEMVSWDDAAAYCNALSVQRGYEVCYRCEEGHVRRSCTQATKGAIYTCPGYRLPTDAEWERACRAGSTTTFYSGEVIASACDDCKVKDPNADKIGWYCANAGTGTHPVAQKQANAWGLYDMAGNVWEWCHEGYQGHLGSASVTDPEGPASSTFRLLRGGSWINTVTALFSAQRYSIAVDYYNNGVGFRCVRTLNP